MKQALLLVTLAALFTSCKALKAIDSANSIPDKLDSTSRQINTTNSQMRETNDGIHKQTLNGALDDMLKERNSTDLEPVALGMLEGGDIFTKAASSDELIKNTWILLNQIKDSQPKESLRGADGEFPADVVAKYDQQKMVQFNELIVLAGLTPEDKVDQIINDEIYAGGLYQDEAYMFLMARVYFLGAYLDNKLLARQLNTVKKMEEAINKVASIDKILKLSFKYDISMKIVGFVKHAPIIESLYVCKLPDVVKSDGSIKVGKNVSCNVPKSSGEVMSRTWNAPELWEKIDEAFDTDLKNGNIVTGSNVNASDVQTKVSEMRERVKSLIASWKK